MFNRTLARFNLAIVRRSTLHELEKAAAASLDLPDQTCTDETSDHLNNLGLQIDMLISRQTDLLQGQVANAARIIDTFDRFHCPLPALTCPLCGTCAARADFTEHESQCIFGGGRLTRFECHACDVIFGPEKMMALTSSQLTEEYSVHFRAYSEAYDPADEVRAFFKLDPRPGGRYLNYGCGANTAGMEQLRDAGWEIWGYEPNERAMPSNGFLVQSQSALSTMKFDGIYSNNVLEHFQNPVGELKFMQSLLVPAGRMAHATPCFEYRYEFTRFHLFFFPGRSRELLAQRAGLRIRSFEQHIEFMCAVLETDHPMDKTEAQIQVTL